MTLSSSAWFRVALATAAIAVPCVIAVACSETGPDAPGRTNGCIGSGCPVIEADATTNGDATTDEDGSTDSGPVYGDPLEGTTLKAELVRGRFRFTEGPLWIGGHLLFTDIPANQILELFEDGGGTSQFRGNSGGANGLAIDQAGQLIACEGSAKRLTRSPPTRGAAATPIAQAYAAQPLNAPNDVIVRFDGNIYFTDPNYSGNPDTQDAEAVYRIDPAGALTRVAQAFTKPNGIALSPNGAILYVVDNGTGRLLSAPITTAGEVGAFAELATVPGGDGMAVDDGGNLYVADDAGIDVFDRTGKKLGTVTVAVKASNCTFGGVDRRTLFITANGPEPGPDAGRNPQTGLYSIHLNVPGLP